MDITTYRHLDYEVLIHKNQYRAAMKWCEEQFGKRWEALQYRQGLWSVFWAGNKSFDQYRFCFAHERDMLMFILRWV
jgi:hypothetical protein